MSRPPEALGEPITNKSQLIAYMASGCAAPEAWRIGTEHEKFVFDINTLRPVGYEGDTGIRALLNGLTRFGWTAVEEYGNPIALTKDKCAITLEPGGQFELSGAPLETLHQTCAEVHTHLVEVQAINEEIGAAMIGLGFLPQWERKDITWMPKGRYEIMGNYMPTKGNLGIDMMTRTCTVQVNLDFATEADMVRKFRISLALQPLATALFANSPFTEGKPNGYLSFRSQVWNDTDPDRCGMLPFVFEDGFGFERYVDYMLDVPMYFVYRDGIYHNVAGLSFRDFMAGKLAGFEGQTPYISDWVDHMTTVFPEVRLKKYIEMRGADGGPWDRLCALPAFWVGLLYDSSAEDAVWDLVKDWSLEEITQLRDEVPRHGLKTAFRGGNLQHLAKQVLAISRAGLTARQRLDAVGDTEAHFLNPLDVIADSGITAADQMLANYHGRWQQSVLPIYDELRY
jgi:glutamate--cysteine ligase